MEDKYKKSHETVKCEYICIYRKNILRRSIYQDLFAYDLKSRENWEFKESLLGHEITIERSS